MIKHTQAILFLVTTIIYSQTNMNSNWLLFSKEKVVTIEVSKTEIFKIKNLSFNIVWNNKLSHSENIGFYGGIQTLTIYKNNKKLQSLNNIEDGIALGTIYFDFYDYNLDGYLDFTVPIDCGKICWDKYYIYNPQTNKYENRKDWDYLRIQKIDKIKKLILSQPDGNALEDNRKIYQIKGIELIEQK
ncbi:MAG: XAC2610-related protein [Lutibacter sp.]